MGTVFCRWVTVRERRNVLERGIQHPRGLHVTQTQMTDGDT